MPDAEILIVEDEPDIAELMRYHVTREGYQAEIVGSGRVALEAIQRRSPDLVLLDLMLPDLDGLEVCRRLKYDSDTRTVADPHRVAKGEETDIVSGLELGRR